MRIGILKTGDLPPEIETVRGTYGEIFARLLRDADPGLDAFTVDVDGGERLPAPDAADGWLVTGSRHGAYEDHAWIAPLEALLRGAVERGVPVFGVCFGHQILAQALGGRVEKFPGGWGLGVQTYEATARPGWLRDLPERWRGMAIHQDQVTEMPPGATRLATSAFCANAALAYGDAEAPVAVSVQPHPEYDAAFFREIAELRLLEKVPEPTMRAAMDSLDDTLDNAAWVAIMTAFFRRAARKTEGAG